MDVLNSTQLHLPPLKFLCVGGCCDRKMKICILIQELSYPSGNCHTSKSRTVLPSPISNSSAYSFCKNICISSPLFIPSSIFLYSRDSTPSPLSLRDLLPYFWLTPHKLEGGGGGEGGCQDVSLATNPPIPSLQIRRRNLYFYVPETQFMVVQKSTLIS